MKILAVTTAFLLFSLSPLSSFSQNSFVEVSGKVYNAKDSSALAASILYEKLPYYDDIGMTSSNTVGDYKVMLIKDLNYNLSIELKNFEQFSSEITVLDEGNSKMNVDLYVTPIEEEIEELITLDNLTFRRGSATIQPSSFESLDEFAQYLKERPNITIQLEGHTDVQGNPDANFQLSQARVDAVAEYLSGQGVKKNRITTKAFGGTQPLTTERTPEAMAKNRRVEVRLRRNNKN